MSDPASEPTRLDIPAVQPGYAAPPPPPAGPPGGDAGAPPPRSWWWWVAGAIGALLVIGIIVLLLAGDDGDDGGATTTSSSSTTSTSTTSTSTSTTSTSTTSPTSTTAVVPTTTTRVAPTTTVAIPPITADPAQCAEAGSDPDNAEPAALAVFVAWTRDDRGCAAELMTPAALGELFSRDGSEASDVFQHCTENTDEDPFMDCVFTYEGGATHYLMNFSPTDGWTVFDVTQFAD